MGAQVSWRDAAGLSGVVELSYSEIFIGRSMECAIRTDDPMVSRRHARIYFQDGRHIIEDLGSANGIYVAEQRTQMHVFNTGDNVRCGNLWVQYTSDGMMASPGPAPGFGTDRTAMVGGMPGFAGSGGFGGGGGGGGFGVPPPSAGAAPSYSAPTPMPAPMAGNMGGGGMNEAEFIRMQRRVDQLQSEVRLLRGGGDKALRMEELEDKVSRLESERSQLEQRCMILEQSASQGGHGGVQIGTAQLQLGRAEEVVNGLNDVLSELRINVLAAEGAIEEWEKQLPRASYDLVREALRSCRMQMETVRDLMRLLRAEARGGN